MHGQTKAVIMTQLNAISLFQKASQTFNSQMKKTLNQSDWVLKEAAASGRSKDLLQSSPD